MMTYLLMCWEFLKTGLFAVGGGLATLPFLREISLKYNWYTLSELSNMIAIGNATPGPIGVNMATYAGFTTGGVGGGLLATIAMVIPSFIVILIVASILDKFRNSMCVEGAFKGLRPAVVAMISIALIELGREVFIKPDIAVWYQSISIKHIILFAGLFLLSKLQKKNNILLYIAIGAVAGIIFKM